MPYTPPNPYSNYFEFGEPEQQINQAFGSAGATGGFSPSVLQMMGASTGGFNPTVNEFYEQQRSKRQNELFMAEMLRSDPRAQVASRWFLNSFFDNDKSRRQFLDRVAGSGHNLNEWMGYAINMPGISDMLGGRVQSLGVGSMAMSTSGMRFSGQAMFGQGLAQDQAARSIFQNIQSRFYTPQGAANLEMTQGLNRNQIGGIQMIAAAQGAFSGMNIGEITQSGGQMHFGMNQANMDRIAEFTKQAAGAISSIIDIYGDSSVGELFQKAQQITGMDFSRMQNAQLMQNRLNELRNVARSTGQDVQSVFDVSAGAVRMGQMMGLDPQQAGTAAQFATRQGAFANRISMLNANEIPGGQVSQRQAAGYAMRDIVGMARDPVGMRRAALEMMIQTGRVDDEDVQQMRQQLSQAGPGDEAELDRMFRNRLGVNIPEYVRTFGGPVSMLNQLRPEGARQVMEANQDAMRRRQVQLIGRRINTLRPGLDEETRNRFQEMVSGLDVGTATAIGQSIDQGRFNATEIRGILREDFEGRRNEEDYLRQARRISRSLRGTGVSAESVIRETRQAMNADPLLRTFQTESDIRESADMVRRNAPQFEPGVREMRGGTFIQGMLEQFGRRDPKSVFAYLREYQPELIAGLGAGREMFVQTEFNAERMRTSIQNMRQEFSRPAFGGAWKRIAGQLGMDPDADVSNLTDTQLKDIHRQVNDPLEFQKLFGRFEHFRIAGKGGRGAQELFVAPRGMEVGRMAASVSPVLEALESASADEALNPHQFRLMQARVKSILTGERHRVQDGEISGTGERLTLERQRQMWENTRNTLAQGITSLGLDPEEIGQLGGKSPALGQRMADAAKQRLQSIQSMDEPNQKMVDRLEKILSKLEEQGITPTGAEIQKIKGQLRLVKGGDALELEDVTMQQIGGALEEAQNNAIQQAAPSR